MKIFVVSILNHISTNHNYSYGPKVIPQGQKSHSIMYVDVYTTLHLASALSCFWCHLKVEPITY